MTRTVTKGYADTAVSGVSSLVQDLPVLNWTADWRVLVNEPEELVAMNMTTPFDQPETFRFASRAVKNIYQGADDIIGVGNRLDNVSGQAIVVQLREVHAITDTSDSTFRRLAPITVGITMTIPNDVSTTSANVLGMVRRACAGLYEQGVSTDTGVTALIKGIKKKQALSG